MEQSSISALAIALVSGLSVAILTQWRQDSRHQDLRNDKEDERRSEMLAESQRRQLEAVARFMTEVRRLENKRREEWSTAVIEIEDDHALKTEGVIKNVNYVQNIHNEIDKLDLQLLHLKVRSHLPSLRASAKKLYIDPDEPDGDPVSNIPVLPTLDTAFERARRKRIDAAREELNPEPPERFYPFLT